MKLADLPQVRALPAEEKLQLLDELWQDVARDLESMEVSPAERKLLDERWAAFQNDPSSALSLEQFKTQVRALRG
jgi:putative addiction module component (TIGR02574 family)